MDGWIEWNGLAGWNGMDWIGWIGWKMVQQLAGFGVLALFFGVPSGIRRPLRLRTAGPGQDVKRPPHNCFVDILMYHVSKAHVC